MQRDYLLLVILHVKDEGNLLEKYHFSSMYDFILD